MSFLYFSSTSLAITNAISIIPRKAQPTHSSKHTHHGIIVFASLSVFFNAKFVLKLRWNCVETTSLSSNLSPISEDYTKRITPFYSPNSGNNYATLTFDGLTANEGVNLMLFTRYGSHVMTLTVDANSKISAYDVQKLTGTNTLTVTISADGKSISFHVGNYSALCGLFIHPHYPNATLTVTRSAS